MNKKLMFVGFGATLASILCFGSAQSAAPQPSESSGRYRMFSTQPASGDIFVIDTQTGRIWKRDFYTDIKGIYMMPQPYVTADSISASAVPSDNLSLESLSLQKRFDKEKEKAQEKTTGTR